LQGEEGKNLVNGGERCGGHLEGVVVLVSSAECRNGWKE
jgi:hypothetical protein